LVLRRLDATLYDKGLCFGMVAGALMRFADSPVKPPRSAVSDLQPSPNVIAALQRYHALQYRPRAIVAAVWDWLRSLGGRPDRVIDRLRLAGVGADPHVLCFGPALNRRFLWCLARAHSVAPYRIEAMDGERRVYVYDPNHPKDRRRCVVMRRDATGKFARFSYDEFGTEGGWGMSLVPVSAIGNTTRLGPGAVL